MPLIDAITLAEPGQNVHSLGCELPDSILEGKDWDNLRIGMFHKTSVHEALTD